jgi:hypothetical protein
MSENNTTYTATVGERWDSISHAVYGTPYDYERIQRANPTVTDRFVMARGRVLFVPVVESVTVAEQQRAINQSKLPPWRR